MIRLLAPKNQYFMRSSRKEYSGFTLIELLVAVAILSAIVTAVLIIITNQIRQNISQEVRTQQAEEWAAVASFINDDVFLSERAYIAGANITSTEIKNKADNAGSGSCGLAASTIKLGLLLDDETKYVLYSVSTPAGQESTIWQGPFVLRRCGPLNVNGDLSGSSVQSILIGNLPNSNSFEVARGLNSLGQGSLAARDISIRLTIENGFSRYSGLLGGQARVSPTYNLLKDDSTSGDSCSLNTDDTALACSSNHLIGADSSGNNGYLQINCTPGSYCDQSNVYQYKPNTSSSITIVGSDQSDIEDVVYFSENYSEYAIPTCSRSRCTVNRGGASIVILDGNVLVFKDKEIRI